MDTVAHVEQLRRKHEALGAEVEKELRHPGSDDLHISELKRQKLKLKEEIERLSHD
jgi:hypothetical protein